MDVGDDLVVVGPSGRGDVDSFCVRGGGGVEFGEEGGAQVHGASAGDCLEGHDTLVGDGWGVLSEDELLAGGGEVCQATDGEVLMVEVRVFAEEVVGLGGGVYESVVGVVAHCIILCVPA